MHAARAAPVRHRRHPEHSRHAAQSSQQPAAGDARRTVAGRARPTPLAPTLHHSFARYIPCEPRFHAIRFDFIIAPPDGGGFGAAVHEIRDFEFNARAHQPGAGQRSPGSTCQAWVDNAENHTVQLTHLRFTPALIAAVAMTMPWTISLPGSCTPSTVSTANK